MEMRIGSSEAWSSFEFVVTTWASFHLHDDTSDDVRLRLSPPFRCTSSHLRLRLQLRRCSSPLNFVPNLKLKQHDSLCINSGSVHNANPLNNVHPTYLLGNICEFSIKWTLNIHTTSSYHNTHAHVLHVLIASTLHFVYKSALHLAYTPLHHIHHNIITSRTKRPA